MAIVKIPAVHIVKDGKHLAVPAAMPQSGGTVDLSDYYNKPEVDSLLDERVQKQSAADFFALTQEVQSTLDGIGKYLLEDVHVTVDSGTDAEWWISGFCGVGYLTINLRSGSITQDVTINGNNLVNLIDYNDDGSIGPKFGLGSVNFHVTNTKRCLCDGIKFTYDDPDMGGIYCADSNVEFSRCTINMPLRISNGHVILYESVIKYDVHVNPGGVLTIDAGTVIQGAIINDGGQIIDNRTNHEADTFRRFGDTVLLEPPSGDFNLFDYLWDDTVRLEAGKTYLINNSDDHTILDFPPFADSNAGFIRLTPLGYTVQPYDVPDTETRQRVPCIVEAFQCQVGSQDIAKHATGMTRFQTSPFNGNVINWNVTPAAVDTSTIQDVRALRCINYALTQNYDVRMALFQVLQQPGMNGVNVTDTTYWVCKLQGVDKVTNAPADLTADTVGWFCQNFRFSETNSEAYSIIYGMGSGLVYKVNYTRVGDVGTTPLTNWVQINGASPNLTVDGVESVETGTGQRNIELHKKISVAQLNALIADPSAAQEGVIYRVEDDDVLVAQITPDDSKTEGTNRINTPNGTWTADRSGWVHCVLQGTPVNSSAPNSVWVGVTVNSKFRSITSFILNGGFQTFRCVERVVKGDIVALRVDPNAPTNWIAWESSPACYFIPPKLSFITAPKIVEKTTLHDYAVGVERQVMKADGTPYLNRDGKPVYEQNYALTIPSVTLAAGQIQEVLFSTPEIVGIEDQRAVGPIGKTIQQLPWVDDVLRVHLRIRPGDITYYRKNMTSSSQSWAEAVCRVTVRYTKL